jgi:pSer/pThr/pTyr-binding forkhead associated (FHA) protein
MPALIALDGPLEGKRFELDQELHIGRESEGLTVDDPGVSRRHAVVRTSGESFAIEDLGSLNGTFVNGDRIGAVTPLMPGDTVRIGATSFEFEGASISRAVTVASPALRVEAPQTPFGAYGQANVTGRSRRRIESRQLLPELITILAIVSTAVGLALYFALR